MKYVGVKYSGGIYCVSVPSLATDDPMGLHDEIILELGEKITRLENKEENSNSAAGKKKKISLPSGTQQLKDSISGLKYINGFRLGSLNDLQVANINKMLNAVIAKLESI